MKNRRLKHCAHVLCHMFRGWRLHSDWDTLVHLGSGDLMIDVINQKCQHNGNSQPPLNIVLDLRKWLIEELSDYNIPLNEIIQAKVDAKLKMGLPEPTPSGPGVPCSFNCHSQISTDEIVYESTYEDNQVLIVDPDALELEKEEKIKLIKECFRLGDRSKM